MKTQKPSPKTPEDAQKTLRNTAVEPSGKEKGEDTQKEIGGYEDAGLQEPTRFGDWEVKGRCSDF